MMPDWMKPCIVFSRWLGTSLTSTTTTDGTERVFLVGVSHRGRDAAYSTDDSLAELALLAETAGLEVAGTAQQAISRPDPSTLIGKGKVEEVREYLEAHDIATVIFDEELSPRHLRELESRLGNETKVLDRSALILDIFAKHANSHEGALQVELAQYEYRLPRLTRQWTHLARQAGGGAARGGTGGVGVRGPGETQLEVDRREIGRRITKLKSDLERVRAHRKQVRSNRHQSGVPLVAIVGYTNAGKSTLLNAISGSSVYTADQLFATLDPTTRRIATPSGQQFLMTDTVGFIQKLPTTLIAAFRATLEEIREADIIAHVVDASSRNWKAQIDVVQETLSQIGVPDCPTILIWNKCDLAAPPTGDLLLTAQFDYMVQVSAQRHSGLNELYQAITEAINSLSIFAELLIPYDRASLISQLYERAQILERQDLEQGTLLRARLPIELFERFQDFRMNQEDPFDGNEE
jgi:GTPase